MTGVVTSPGQIESCTVCIGLARMYPDLGLVALVAYHDHGGLPAGCSFEDLQRHMPSRHRQSSAGER